MSGQVEGQLGRAEESHGKTTNDPAAEDARNTKGTNANKLVDRPPEIRRQNRTFQMKVHVLLQEEVRSPHLAEAPWGRRETHRSHTRGNVGGSDVPPQL